MMNYSFKCYVLNCRFPFTHVVAGHKCGKCNEYGHGQRECTNILAKHNLKRFLNDIVPNEHQCTRPYCTHNKYHTTDAHICNLCNELHSEYNCSKNPLFINRINKETNGVFFKKKVQCPMCRADNIIESENITSNTQNIKCIICMDTDVKFVFFPTCRHICCCESCCKELDNSNTDIICFMPDTSYDILNEYSLKFFINKPGKIFISIYAGMGCFWLVKRDDIGHLPEIWFHHNSDNYDSSVIEQMEKFINGYTKVNVNSITITE